MKNECSIVRDLLPLYAEGMLSTDTTAFAKEHLESCPACKAEWEAMQKPSEIERVCAEEIQQRSDEALPLKTVKRKFRKRTMGTILAAVFLTAAVIGICVHLQPVSIDYGVSELYSRQDMDAAIQVITDEFDSWNGCKLYSIGYTDDERCAAELDYCRTLGDGSPFTECVVFRTCFRSPIWGGGAWNANEIYYWDWYLARVENGSWQLLTWGAA